MVLINLKKQKVRDYLRSRRIKVSIPENKRNRKKRKGGRPRRFGNSLINGRLTLPNFLLSFWEAIVCVGMCISLVAIFRSQYNVQGKDAKVLSDNTFSVYLIHVPIIVFLQYLLIGVNVHPLIKFAVVHLIGVPVCFLFSHYVVRRFPPGKYIL